MCENAALDGETVCFGHQMRIWSMQRRLKFPTCQQTSELNRPGKKLSTRRGRRFRAASSLAPPPL